MRPSQLVLIGAIAAVHIVATILTWRDLHGRPAALVRGNKRVWRIASAVNTGGSIAYWLVGRREGTTLLTLCEQAVLWAARDGRRIISTTAPQPL